MEIIVRGKHFDVPEGIEARARKKLTRIEHYLPALNDAAAEVHMAQERAKEPQRRYVVRVTVSGRGVHLQAEERAASLEAAVDGAADVLSRQARKQKGRLYGRGRSAKAKQIAAQPDVAPVPDDDEDGALSKVARVERLAVKPMTTEEALEQMELLGQDFFLFHDAGVGQFALLYRRPAGDYGMIIPELP